MPSGTAFAVGREYVLSGVIHTHPKDSERHPNHEKTLEMGSDE